MAQNYCETIVCSVIKSVSALQLLQDIMIHVSLSSCYGCLRKVVEICTYCFPFSSFSSPSVTHILSFPSCFLQKFSEIQSCLFTHINACIYLHIYTQMYVYIFPSFSKATIKHCILFRTFYNYGMHKVSFSGW